MYDLECIYDSRKSFYAKARVVETKKGSLEDLILYSYNTIVARIQKTPSKIKYSYYGKYSTTTSRHQREFFRQNGLNEDEIKQLMKTTEKNEIVKEMR